MNESKPPIVNCHTHIFTGDHVPPWLAKTFLPWPLYYLIPLSGIVHLLRWWYDRPYRIQFRPEYKKIARFLYNVRMFLQRSFILSILINILGIYFTINVFFFSFDWLSKIKYADSVELTSKIQAFRGKLEILHVLNPTTSLLIKIAYIIFLLLFFESGRNLITFILKNLFKFLGMLPGKQTTELLKRYILIGRFSRYKTQSGIFSKLCDQYPPETGIVVLPMDMENMGAGSLKDGYHLGDQIEELAKLKASKSGKKIFPFIFADPRRIKSNKAYFDYTIDSDGKIILADNCLIKKWIEVDRFSGIKIYPALGYFPFDEDLLILFKYAADKQIPIITHCIRGTIFFRGKKKKEWDKHPIFMQSMGKEIPKNELDTEDMGDKAKSVFCEMLLPQRKNIDFTTNFTHPLNFLGLLEETLLRQVVAKSTDERIKKAFGYNGEDKPLLFNLNKLKICLGHFGGDDEWLRFMESDRNNYSNQLFKEPNKGIEFMYDNYDADKKFSPGKLELIWKYADWYSIICSMMLQFPNIYADISYILYKPEILPLLKQTLENPNLREKVLYGTDFYVVRNHKSDKELLADMMAGLSEKDFDQIARYNPRKFLNI